MKFLYKMEMKFGKYAIKNLSAVIVCCFIFGYILNILMPNVYSYVTFSPYHIVYEHQIWRIFTWIFTIPGGFDFFTLIMLYFYWKIGQNVEYAMGRFMFNLYIFGGMFITTVSCLVTTFIFYFNNDFDEIISGTIYLEAGSYMGIGLTSIMLQSVFFGFALIYSDAMVMLYFILPIKVKYLAWIELVLLGYQYVNTPNILFRVAIIASVANFVIFYIISRNYKPTRHFAYKLKRKKTGSGNKVNRKQGSYQKVVEIPSNITKHKCAVCGKSEKDDYELEFRFCSKCNGNYEYCSEHLYTHEHVK